MLRTLFLTPARQVIHRMDLCPYGSDAGAEIRFALKLREQCLDENWAPRPGAEVAIFDLRADHVAGHKKQVGVASECGCALPEVGGSGSRNPWPGYNQGLLWHTDLKEAQELAKKTGRRLFYFQIVGDLHKDGC